MDRKLVETGARKDVDIQFWGQMSGWTVSEAAALLLAIDPDHLPENSSEKESLGWKYSRLLRLLDRAREMNELDSPMTPREFLRWATSNGLVPPDDLKAIVGAGKPHRNWRIRYNKVRRERDLLQKKVNEMSDLAVEPHPRARASFLILIGGLVRAKLGHKKGSSKTVSLIDKAIQDAKGHLAKNTIMGCLIQADEYFEEKFPEGSI